MPDILHHWTPTGLRGLAALVFGVAALLFPGPPHINLVLLFGVYTLIDGALALATARTAVESEFKGFLIAEGLISIGSGLLTFIYYPFWSILLPRLIGAWVVATGLLRLVEVIRERQVSYSRWLVLLAGLSALPVSYFLLVIPVANEQALALIRLIGAYAVGLGLILLAVAGRFYEPE